MYDNLVIAFVPYKVFCQCLQQVQCLFHRIVRSEFDGIFFFVGMKVPVEDRDAVMPFQSLENVVQGHVFKGEYTFFLIGETGGGDIGSVGDFVY